MAWKPLRHRDGDMRTQRIVQTVEALAPLNRERLEGWIRDVARSEFDNFVASGVPISYGFQGPIAQPRIRRTIARRFSNLDQKRTRNARA